MRRLLLISLSAACFAGSAAAEGKRCQLQVVGEMDVSGAGAAITTQGQIDGKPVRMIVDTSAWGTLLFENDARKLDLVLRRTGAIAYGVGGGSDVYSVRVEEFRLGSLSERGADLLVTGQTLGGVQGVVGAKFPLHSHRVFIAREQHRVYATYEGGPVFRAGPPPKSDGPTKP